jgi:hypothetical protein
VLPALTRARAGGARTTPAAAAPCVGVC